MQVDALEKLVPLGLRPGTNEVFDLLGISVPRPGEATLRNAGNDDAQGHAQNRMEQVLLALNQGMPAAKRDELDALSEDGLDDWEAMMQPMAAKREVEAAKRENALLREMAASSIGMFFEHP